METAPMEGRLSLSPSNLEYSLERNFEYIPTRPSPSLPPVRDDLSLAGLEAFLAWRLRGFAVPRLASNHSLTG